ncbi:MAG: SIS domain-containing protein [Chloroflexi bacterium]|uniref:SIS domain-containing protein n=1 Tax=Candidatus Flexifilum breve TaxID=3140694 RepID=UPI0031363064|nr:SIS domain-containing protein [Chloroflexota bacterium]
MQTSPSSFQTLSEILSQPEAWQDALDELARQQGALRAFYAQHQPDHLIFLGCGSPYFLARAGASLARGLTGILSEAHPGSDMWLFTDQTLIVGRSTVMVVISRSGETTEVLKAIETFNAQGGKAIAAVTCYDESTLARTIPLTLLAKAGQEIGLAQTRSFTSMLILTQGLIYAFANRELSPRFLQLPQLGRALIEKCADFAQQFGSTLHQRFERVFFLGGGALYGLACEAMLKMKEMSLSLSEAYQTMEFRHGPMSMVNEQTLIVALVSETATTAETQVLTEMRQRGATVLAVTPVTLPEAAADEQIVLPEGLTDAERGPLYLPILHLAIYHHTVAKGLNPDLPNNLTAVIELNDDHTNKAQLS